jgi:hypothetical protein
MAAIPPAFHDPLLKLVRSLVANRFAELAAAGSMGRVDPADAQRVLDQYPATFREPPIEILSHGDAVEVIGVPGEWRIDLPLWTAEEGRSDLELRVTGHRLEDGSVEIELDDILVP